MRLKRILFLENSGYPLDALRKVAVEENAQGKRVEFISMNNNYSPPNLGYGYSEFAMLDQGFAESELAKESKYWIKTTGRFRFPSITRLLDRLQDDYLFAVDVRASGVFTKHPTGSVTTQLMIVNGGFFRDVLTGVNLDMTTPCIENAVYSRLRSYYGKPGAIFRWPINVVPHGIAAGINKDYQAPGERIKHAVRGVARRVLPFLWF